MQKFQEPIEGDSALASIFAPNGTILNEGDLVKREAYAKYLELISTEGADAFYKVSCSYRLS